MKELITAIRIACDAHEEQKDKAGKPYILHPLRIMQKFDDHETMVVAVLHDVVEDSDFDFAYLQSKGLSAVALVAIDALTKRKNESYEEFINRLSSNKIAVRVKVEDLKDNLDMTRLSVVNERDLERIRKYHKALKFLNNIEGSNLE